MKSFKIPAFLASLFGFCLFSSLDTPPAYADFTFGTPTRLEGIIGSADLIGCFSSDGLEMYVSSIQYGEQITSDLSVLRRASKNEDWGPLENLGPTVNSTEVDACPSISGDGLTLYFNSRRAGGYGGMDIWMATRANREAPWGVPVNLGSNVNSTADDGGPWITTDGLELYFCSWRSGGYGSSDLYVTRRTTQDSSWAPATNLGALVNSPASESHQCLSADGLLLVFSGEIGNPVRPGGYGNSDIWVTTRTSVTSPWSAPTNVGLGINSSSHDTAPHISPDGSTLYFHSNRPSGSALFYGDLYQAPIIWRSDFTFCQPVNLKTVIPVIEPAYEGIGCFSSDGLEIYYVESIRPGGEGSSDLWVLKRPSINEPWGLPENLGPVVNSPYIDAMPFISADGLTLHFNSNRPGGYGYADIYVTTRATKSDPWGPPVNLGPRVNSSAGDGIPRISADGLELYFTSWRTAGGYGGADIYVARRATANDPWGEPVNLGPVVNSEYSEVNGCLSPDGLVLIFQDYLDQSDRPRPGGYGGGDLWMIRRASLSDPWQAPVNLGPTVNGPGRDLMPCISLDGRTLYFVTNRDGTWDNWQAPIIPVVDFNGDGIVDMKDFSKLGQHWCQDESSVVDVGPVPWGDGTVDIEDLAVLINYWLKEVFPVDLVAYWKLDETEGFLAHDSAGDHDGTLHGDPTWQPTAGKIDGAIELDGVDDYVSTPFVLNPADRQLSVFAWIKGSGSRQVIISQQNGLNWLGTDPFGFGWLMTELAAPGGRSLFSQAVITDGNWHRVGFVWDGKNRILYVDDVEAARDAQSAVAPSDGGLNIGAGKSLEAGSFWSGLIDHVQIYDRAVMP